MQVYDPKRAQQSMQRQQQQLKQQQNRRQPQSQSIEPFRQHNQLDTYEHDPFLKFGGGQLMESHNQMQKSFGDQFQKMHNKMQKMQNKMLSNFGFGNIGQSLMNFSDVHRGFDDMFKHFDNFSGMHDHMMQMGGQGVMMERSYVQTTTKDPSGQLKTKKYFNNNVVQKGHDGQTISERQQALHDEFSRKQVIAQERMLNNQGRKVIKQRQMGGPEKHENLLYNLNSGQVDDFDHNWVNYNEKSGFTKNHYRLLGHNPNERMLQQDQQREQSFQEQNYYSQKQPYGKRYDDQNRGDFIPYQQKLENQPVNFGRQRALFIKQDDLQPTYGGGGIAQQQQAIPLGQLQNQQNRPIPMRQNQQQRQQNRPALQQGGVYKQYAPKNNIPKAG